MAHIITGVIGSGVLSLAWSTAQLGWIAGPLAMLFFAAITLISTFLLSNCYRTPDPELGPGRNRSYIEAVQLSLGMTSSIPSSSLKFYHKLSKILREISHNSAMFKQSQQDGSVQFCYKDDL